MSLAEPILSGIRRWQSSTVKNLLRSRGHRNVALGRQLSAFPCPETLGEARPLLGQFLGLLPASGKKRVRELLQAVESAESREGVDTESLVEALLQGEVTLAESVQLGLSFPLGPELSAFRMRKACWRGDLAGQTGQTGGKRIV